MTAAIANDAGPLLLPVDARGLALAILATLAVIAALLVSGAGMAIATFVGTFVTTWMTGRIAAALAMSVLIVGLSACEKKEGPAERAGKAVDSAGQKLEKAGQDVQDAAKDAKK